MSGLLRHRVRVYQGTLAILLLVGCDHGADTPSGPPGAGLVFVRLVDGSRDLLWTGLSDGTERAITRTPRREESWPYWSSKAGHLVFQVTEGPGRSDLHLWSPERGERPFVDSPRDERWPVWSPVEPKLAYAFIGGRPSAGLGLVRVDTKERWILAWAGPDYVFLRPSWAPDGSRLVAQRRSPEGSSQLWLLEPGAPERALTKDGTWSDTKARFTRDGRRIVFSRALKGGGPGDIWSMAADGSDARLLLGDAKADEHSGRPSPTRDELAFVSDRSGSPQLWLAKLDGSSPRQLTDGVGGAFTPRWSPDGELLVVSVSTRPERPRLTDRASLEALQLLVIDRKGEAVFETTGLMPDWMPAWR